MKVLLAAVSSASGLSGVPRHAFNLAYCLLDRKEISEVHLAIAPWQQQLLRDSGLPHEPRLHIHIPQLTRGTFGRNSWFYRSFPRLTHQLGADIAHAAYPVPIHRPAFPCPVVVSLHDLYPYEIPSNFGLLKGFFNRRVLQQCLRNADAVACVSDATARSLRRYTGERIWKRAMRIYNHIESQPTWAARAPAALPSDAPFLLCVAQHRRNKNVPLLLRVFANLRQRAGIDHAMRLAIIGISGPQTALIHRLIHRLSIEEQVYVLEGLSEDELQWCYRNCQALIMPSSTEGFGLPVAEALLAGCRVICSDIPALREIADGHCTFVSLSGDIQGSFTAAIARALRSPVPAPLCLPQFSRSVIASQYVELYQELVAAGAPAHSTGAADPAMLAASERTSL